MAAPTTATKTNTKSASKRFTKPDKHTFDVNLVALEKELKGKIDIAVSIYSCIFSSSY